MVMPSVVVVTSACLVGGRTLHGKLPRDKFVTGVRDENVTPASGVRFGNVESAVFLAALAAWHVLNKSSAPGTFAR